MHDVVVTHIKRINKKTGITKIMKVPEAVAEIAGGHRIMAIRDTLVKYGSVMTDEFIYHVIDKERALIEILGRSYYFLMKDGTKHLIKVQGIGFMGVIAGIDENDQYIMIEIDQVDVYHPQGVRYEKL